MYAVFKVRYWLNFYQSYKRKKSFSSYITGKTSLLTALPGWYGLALDLSNVYWLHPVSDRAHFPMPVSMLNRFSSVILFLIWRPPALPHRLQCSTIGRLRLNRRVRDGNGCFPQAHRHQKSRVLNEYKIYRRTNLVRTLFRGTWWEDTMCHRI